MPHLLIISFHQGLSVVRIVQCEERLQEVDSGCLYGIIDEETSLKVTKKPHVHEQIIQQHKYVRNRPLLKQTCTFTEHVYVPGSFKNVTQV